MSTKTLTASTEQAQAVANTIRDQIGVGGLMTLGASGLGYTRENNGGLRFNARILPFNTDGSRSAQPRIMQVAVVLNGFDYYDVTVSYFTGGVETIHYEQADVDVSSLQRLMIALDFDGDTVLNSRYM